MTIKSHLSTVAKRPTVILTRRAIKKLQKASPPIKTTVQSSNHFHPIKRTLPILNSVGQLSPSIE